MVQVEHFPPFITPGQQPTHQEHVQFSPGWLITYQCAAPASLLCCEASLAVGYLATLPTLIALTLAGLLECRRPVHISVCSQTTVLLMDKAAVCAPLGLPLVTVGERHVHAVSAEEGPAVHRCVDAGWVWDGFAHQDSAGQRRLPEAAQAPRWAAVVHFQLSSAVQHLPIGDNERPNVTNSALKIQNMNSLDWKWIFWKIPPYTCGTLLQWRKHTTGGLSWCQKIQKLSTLWPSN